MKKVLIIGSGTGGLSCAVRCAQLGVRAMLVSPFVSERSQSVMAAGGINAVLSGGEDSIECHAEDTLRAGGFIEDREDVIRLCREAPLIIKWFEQMGVMFTRDKNGEIARRAFGGQSFKRTAFAGTSTGKHIVSGLVQKLREYEIKGLAEIRTAYRFHSAMINDGKCYGAVLYNERRCRFEAVYADDVVVATGGMNGLFGKTTGSLLCDGYAAGKLFEQGVRLRNLEFIQYHPTTVKTAGKSLLLSEAARGEGGRLFYIKDGKRIYFMEEQYGAQGNLMPRDIVSRCIYDAPEQVYLDISFLGEELIKKRLFEVYEICRDYAGVDVTKEAVPVYPAVHFFMGGIKTDENHETNISHLYAVGECASKYHGANRLGGNSLLAAAAGGRFAAANIAETGKASANGYDFGKEAEKQTKLFGEFSGENDVRTDVILLKKLNTVLSDDLGITREEGKLKKGIETVRICLEDSGKLNPCKGISPYHTYRIRSMVLLAEAILMSAEERKETRGAHIRLDYPETNKACGGETLAVYSGGKIRVKTKGAEKKK